MVFACSGASDVGGITDQAARKLSREKVASMSCAAAVAAGIPDILKKVQSADSVLVLDGCDHECAAVVMRKGGFEKFAHVRLKELGLEKGKSPATEENIARVTVACSDVLEGKSSITT
ncbi:MAG: putative zinc-binding protein [Candidatus Hydrogenedentes bacterium]|nr:putative zinc-binding protein [Candidatus Hydrogenedentota bacterium]